MKLTNQTKPKLKERIKMTNNIKVLNVVTNEVSEFETVKAIADFIVTANVTDHKSSTVEKKVREFADQGKVLYDTFIVADVEDIEQYKKIEDGGKMSDKVENKEVTEEIKEVTEVDQVEQQETDKKVESDESVEVVEDEKEETKENPPGEDESNSDKGDKESDEKPAEEETSSKRKNGKAVKWYENGEYKDTFPSIKAAATFFKEKMDLKHMPFTPIMKSIRTDVDWNSYSFRLEGQEVIPQPVDEVKDEVKDLNKDAKEIQEEKEEIIEEIVEQAEEIIKEQQEELEEVKNETEEIA
jgi:hypothetical protein